MYFLEFETWIIISYILQIMTLLRVLLRENRSPTSRLAWMLCVMSVPWLGILLYFLFGEVSFGRKDVARMEEIIKGLPKEVPSDTLSDIRPEIPIIFRQSFARAGSVNGFRPTAGNHGDLMADSNATIDAMIADMDAATDHVHLLFYIWLTDKNGVKMIEAAMRAARRGVTVRAMVDGMGSRKLVESTHWQRMAEAGVQLGEAFDMKQAWVHLLFRRMDIRNHRKIMVVDGKITYCGSQNCADPEFAVKPKFAPWVDVMVRLTGPVVWQQQQLFAGDWQTHTGEDIRDLLKTPVREGSGTAIAVSMGTGPTESHQAVPDVFQNLMASAQREIIVTTPYYVPSEALHNRLCAAALRGVDVTLILPKRNDSRLVGMASRSYFLSLVKCGVKLYEYKPGLLHSKLLTVDDETVLFGSANLDRRSFDINFENCMLTYDPVLTQTINARQREYIADSDPVALKTVEAWPTHTRLMNNLFATMGPLL